MRIKIIYNDICTAINKIGFINRSPAWQILQKLPGRLVRIQTKYKKNKIISSMSKATLDIYLNEQKKIEQERKETLLKIENRNFKINNHAKSSFEKYLQSIGSLKENTYLNNRAKNILEQFE